MVKRKSYYKKLRKTRYGTIILPSGERITPKEQNRLRTAVRRANRERNRLIELIPDKEKLRKEQYKKFNRESDFIFRKKSASMRKFGSKQEYQSYLKSVERLANADKYSEYIGGVYKNNYIRSLEKVFNSGADDIINYLKNEVTNREIMELSLSGQLEDIGFVYYEQTSRKNKLNKIKRQVERLRQSKL